MNSNLLKYAKLWNNHICLSTLLFAINNAVLWGLIYLITNNSLFVVIIVIQVFLEIISIFFIVKLKTNLPVNIFMKIFSFPTSFVSLFYGLSPIHFNALRKTDINDVLFGMDKEKYTKIQFTYKYQVNEIGLKDKAVLFNKSFREIGYEFYRSFKKWVYIFTGICFVFILSCIWLVLVKVEVIEIQLLIILVLTYTLSMVAYAIYYIVSFKYLLKRDDNEGVLVFIFIMFLSYRLPVSKTKIALLDEFLSNKH
jgi:hypothetical protein